MDRKYRVVFLSLTEGEDTFKENMARLGVPPETVQTIIKRAPVILKRDMPLAEARHYAEAVQAAGGRVRIQDDGQSEEGQRIFKQIEIKPMDHFTRCMECGYMQLKKPRCERCGHHLH